jgi:hypothetical protein
VAADETPGSLRFSSSRNKLPVGPRVGDTATGNILSRSLNFFPRSEEKKSSEYICFRGMENKTSQDQQQPLSWSLIEYQQNERD